VKILNELRGAKGFTCFVATTFNVDLPWFEALLLRQLHNNGVKRFVVFSDAGQLAESLNTQAENLHRAGRSYLLQKVSSFSSFHPKIILLAGNDCARLYVGSGNLSKGGLQYNLEIFERWDAEKEEKEIPPEFLSVRDYLYELIENNIDYCPSFLKQSLDKTFSLPIFSRTQDNSKPTTFFSSPRSLFRTLPLKNDCNKLTIVSPYFDEHARFIEDLASNLGAKPFTVITDTRKSNLTPDAAKHIEKLGGELLNLNPDQHKRPLHAKMYFSSGPGWAWGAAGSANASNAAWRAHNAEAMSIKEGTDAHLIGNLIDELITRPFVENDWKILEKNAEQKKNEVSEQRQEIPKAPVIQYAEWISLKRVKTKISRGDWIPSIAEICGNNVPITLSELDQKQKDDTYELTISLPYTPDRSRSNLLRLGNRESLYSSWVVIHDFEELNAQASKSGAEREKLEKLLGKNSFDLDAAQKMMEFYAHLLHDRTQKRLEEKTTSNDQKKTKSPKDNRPDQRNVNMSDFITGDDGFHNDPQQKLSGGLILTARHINQLLYGDIDGNINVVDSDGESELGEDSFNDNNESKAKSCIAGKTRKEMSSTKKTTFLNTTKIVRQNYIKHLQSLDDIEEKSPYRLLEDLQVLAAPLHYMYRGGGMTSSAFRAELVQIMRVLIGGNHSPLSLSISQLGEEHLREFWGHTSAFHLLHLLSYNMCLVDLDAGTSATKKDIHGFTKALPVMWLRHLIRTVPMDLIDSLRDKTRNIVPSLRCGVFWLGDILPALEERFPYLEFVCSMIDQSRLLDMIDKEFDGKLSAFVGKINLRQAADEGDIVLGRKVKGTLGIGWVEKGRILIHDGAFQKPVGDHYFEQMSRINQNQTISLQCLEDAFDSIPEGIRRSVQLIKEINP